MTPAAPLDAIDWPPAWPRALDAPFGAPPLGDFRATPDDFRVEECLGFVPEGAGEHLWLWVEKRDLTTAMVARELARACDVPARAIGYAGMKDRVAVTRQWFSLHLPGREAPAGLTEVLAAHGIRVIEQARHPRKLKRGVHRGNRFRLRLTGPAVADAQFEPRWERLCREGVPNYFGPQRFGPSGRNLLRARALLARGWRKRDDRDGMLLSAARSFLFNELLAARLHDGNWATPLPGEMVMLDGSASQFAVDSVDDELRQRAERLDLHPAAPLWGVGESRATGEARGYEARLPECYPALCAGLERAGVRLGRRALRLRLAEPALEAGRDASECWLAFTLPRGAFATAVLREVITHPGL